MSDSCSICMEELTKNTVITKCGHVFHIDCLNKWLSKNYSCPVCRDPCLEKDGITCSVCHKFIESNIYFRCKRCNKTICSNCFVYGYSPSECCLYLNENLDLLFC